MMWMLLSSIALANPPIERVDIDINCGSVVVTVGDLQITGDVEVDRSERVRVRNGADLKCGDVRVQMPAEARLSFESVSGHLIVTGLTGRVDFESVSGSLEVAGASQAPNEAPSKVNAQTVSGNLKIHVGSGADVDAAAVSGNIAVCGGPVARLEASTVSGRVELSVSTTVDSRIEGVAHSGRLSLAMDREPGRLRAETFAGNIENKLTGDRPVPGFAGSRLEVDHDRGPSVELETFAGHIRLQTLTEEYP